MGPGEKALREDIAAMRGAVPEVGARVSVALVGEVTGRADNGAIWVRVGDGIDAVTHRVPAGTAVTVLAGPRPREVLLLECGHVMDHPRPTSTAGTAYCWRFPCHTHKAVVGVGSVNW